MSIVSTSSILQLTKHTVAICPVSGIPYTITFPNLGIDFTYKSPFATLSNIEAIINQPFPKLKALPKVTLAGITLAYLRYKNLCETYSFKAIDCNIALQLCPAHTLISIAKLILSVPDRKIARLPKLSFNSMLENVAHSTPHDIIKAWKAACEDVLAPTTPESVDIEELVIDKPKTTLASEKKIQNVSVHDRKEFKTSILVLARDSGCTAKLTTILNYVSEGMTLITIDGTMRQKLLTKLEEFDSDAAITIRHLLTKYSDKLEDDFLDRAMDNSAIAKAKPSLKDILARKIATKTTESAE